MNLIMSCLLQVPLRTTLMDFEFKLWSCGEGSIYQMTTAVDKNMFVSIRLQQYAADNFEHFCYQIISR